jgi:hypothetical protein
MSTGAPKTRDYFAEMYVAGIMADNGWNVYFPRRDKGFDFIITRSLGEFVLVRPVQVKGKYPQETKGNQAFYGYNGKLTALHPDMVLALPYFPSDITGVAPVHIAYMPKSRIKVSKSWGFQCHPACFRDGGPQPRRDFAKYFDSEGLKALDSPTWG